MMLLTKDIRAKLPKLYAQKNLGGKAIVFVKFFTPWSNWTWYATEGSPVIDDEGKEIDFRFFGLVDGLEKECGYFLLSEFDTVTGPGGLKIERDRGYGTKKTLEQVAPELFN